MTSRLFGVGIAGTAIAPAEREILERFPPGAVILFRRNIETGDQLSALTDELRRLCGELLLCVDQEGGSVDRLREVLGPSISFRSAARAGVARRAGELAGEACARFGFEVDLAPVVDRCLPGRSERALRDRCASEDPEEVARAASEFLEGLRARGIGGCVKHFPGLGRADRDTHESLPRLPGDPREEKRDLAPFAATMDQAGAVMISHAAGPHGTPASLSRATASELLREKMRFAGAAFSDDLEMGALAAFGDLPRRSVLAARAGCDLLFVCSRIAAYPECIAAVEREVSEERRDEAARRLARYAGDLRTIRASSALPDRPIEDLAADIGKLRVLGIGSQA